MNTGAVLTEMATKVAAIIGADIKPYRNPARAREARHSPCVYLRNWRYRGDASMGGRMCSVEAVFLVDETDTANAENRLYAVVSTGAGGHLEQIASIESDTGLWHSLGSVSAQIDDQHLLGQITYRAAIVQLEFICDD